jgi:hypothetical protein
MATVEQGQRGHDSEAAAQSHNDKTTQLFAFTHGTSQCLGLSSAMGQARDRWLTPQRGNEG